MGSGASREGEEAGDHGSSPTTVQSSSSRDGARQRGSRRHRAKKAAQVGLTKLGFSPSELCVDEGEEVLFHWGVGKGAGHNIRQVVVDDGKVSPVNGGFFSGEPTGSGSFRVRFSYSGVYSFISDSYGNQASSAFKLTVDPRPIRKVEIKERGFVEPEIHIREGTVIRFQWSSPTPDRPHTITEVKLSPKHCGWVRTDTGSFTPSQSGWYKHEFREPGIFYFLTEAEEGEARNHLCVVEVESGQRQHWIDVTDVRFNPRLLTIQEGERVWWSWDRFQCLKKHKIIQVELPSGHDVSNPFPRVVRGGFVSGPPSRRGMLSHVFDKPGVFYYCDNNYEDVREYLGVVVVKPKPKSHPIEVTADGFYPDLSVVSAGDKIVWTWDASQIQQSFSIMQVENCVVGSSKGNVSDDCSNKCDFLDEEHALQLTRLGMATTQLGSMGVYHFRVADTPASMGCCSIIVNAAVKHHVINITKTGYEPHLLTVHPGDHVWWTWDRVHGQHNVVQVSREGESIPSGFCSGPPIDGPGAFYTCFDKEGVVYFHSAGLPKLYGAIMTVPTPKVHQVIASKNSLTPDPVTVKSGDCVAWVWPVLRKHKLIAVTSTQEVFELQKYTQDSVSPRRCCALQFTNPGVFHYYSKAFSNKTEKFMYEHSSKAVLSSVVVSVPKEETVVRVTRKGFSPSSINIRKGHTVVWTWKETNMEFHNISLVTPPNVDLQPVSVIPTSKGGFTSGLTEALGSYSHCWDAAGTYHVMSEGAKNELGVVCVLDSDAVTRTPVPSDNDSGTVVQRGHRIDLTAGQEEMTIYYTLDGSIPEPNGPSTRILKPEQGIVLKRSGLHIIRAVAHSRSALPSEVFTSRRYWVLEGESGELDDGDEDDAASMATEDFNEQQVQEAPGPTTQWRWWQCVPMVRGWIYNTNTVELYWDLPHADHSHLVEAYQIFVNDVCYHNNLVPPCHSVRITGFVGGVSYLICVVAMPTSASLLPQGSVKLRFDCPLVSDQGGPILSCEITDIPHQLPVVWSPLPQPGFRYQLYVNGVQHKEELIHTGDEKECRVTVTDCLQDRPLRVHLLALPSEPDSNGTDQTGLLSNDLDISMPLYVDHMTIPKSGKLVGLPYLQVLEGSLSPPGPDARLLPEVSMDEENISKEASESLESATVEDCALSPSSVSPAKINMDINSAVSRNSDGFQSLPEDDGSQIGGEKSMGEIEADENEEGLTPTLRSVRSTANHPELHIHWNHPDADTGAGQDKGSTRPHPRLHHYLVCVEGIDFINQDVNSHARHETSSPDGESSTRHYWNAGRGTQLVVNRGLCESSQYRVNVAAVFKHPDGKKKLSKSTSVWMAVTTGGHPVPPRLSLVSVGVQEVTVSWEPGRCHEDIEVLGYTVLRNGKPLGKMVPYGITEKTIQDLKPGSKSTLSVATVTSIGGPRKCSNSITVVCPRVPDTPSIAIKQSSSLHSATIIWQKQKAKHLAGYIIYTDGKQRAEIEMSELDRQSQCRYVLEDLMEGRDISVYMKAYAGWKNLPPNHNSGRVLCRVMSGRSNTLSVTGKTPPSSPSIRLEGMHSGGVDIMWEGLQQDEGCHLTGFVVLQEGLPHGPLLDPHSTRCTVSHLKPGTTLSVQVMAVSRDLFEPGGEDLCQQYPTCEPGPSLKVVYTGLLAPPTKVWTELVTGHSMLVVWRRGKKPNKTHYTDPDSFMVRWWQTDHQEDTISSQETSDDNLPIEGLESGCSYTIIVEARKWSTYYDDEDEGILGDDELRSTYLVTAASDPITVQTARPPDPPSDLKVTTAGPKSVELRWKPAVEHGSEILGLKMYVTLVGKGDSDASGETIHCVDLLPDATEATINDLVQGKEYTIHLVAVTDDFFDQLPDSHPLHKAHNLPRSWSEISSEVSSQWLPYVSIQARTHANSPPSGLRCTDSGVDWLTVGWRPPAWGGYSLGSYMVEWEDVTPDGGETISEDSMEGSVEVGHTHSHAKLRNLTPGRSYEIQVKAYMKPDATSKSGTKQNGGKQVMMNVILESDPITIRLPCRIQAPSLRIAGFSSYHIDLRWTRPQLALKSDNKDSKVPSKLLRCTLLGYRLTVEGNTPIYLSHDTTRYTLTQVRGGRTVKVQLIAVTTNKKVMLRSERKKGAGMGGGGDQAQKMMASVLKSIGDNKDETKTRMLYITVPKTQSGAIMSCTCTYHHLRKASSDSEEADMRHDSLGYINVQWSLLDCGSAEEQGILGYDVSWMCDADGKEQVASISEDCTSYQIPVKRLGCVYDIGIQPVKDEDIWQDLNSPTIQCEVPGPPDPPTLCCVSMTTTEFILEWAEPRTYGGVGVRGYQVYMNGKKIGHELSAGHYKAAVPCRPCRVYILGIAALSDDAKYADSAHDQDLQLCTPDEDPKAASQVVKVPLLETLSPSAPKRGGQRGHLKNPSGSKLVPEVIDLRPSLVGTYSIGITWDFLRPEIIEKVQRLQVTWSSVVKPKEVEALLSPTASRFTVKNCAAGTNHFITVTGLDKEDRKICRSKQLIVQTSSQLSPPQPYISSSSFKGCTVKWDKPKEYRGASLSGFRLRMNGQHTTTLPATATAFTYRHGKMGHDYSFSLQAVCSDPHLSSDFSDPVHATWPGVVLPDLVRTPSTRVNAINIGWSIPELVGGAKVRQFKVLCMEEQSGLNRHAHHAPLISSPALPPDAASTEFNGLIPHQIYTIYLDVYLAGLAKPVRSKALLAQVARRPTAPKLSMRVVGAEERKHLNVEACAMAHDRDRLLQELFDLEFDLQDNYLVDAQYQDDLLSRVAEISSLLADIETSLDHCLENLKKYTGTVSIALSWDLVSDDGDAMVSGYKVLVNGEQYGFVLHSQVCETIIKLNAYNGTHRISLVAVTDHPVGNSDQSNVVSVDTCPYRPFVSYCLNNVHKPGLRYPQQGCCTYQETLREETHPDFHLLPTLHQHLPKRRIPAPSVTVFDQDQGTYRLLMPTKLSNRKPHVVLFWTHWCLASQAIMNHFVQYAKKRSNKVVCMAMCCLSGEDTDFHRANMTKVLSSRGWGGGGALQHCCCCQELEEDGSKVVAGRSLNTSHSLVQHASEKKSSDALSAVSDNVPELFGVIAVPTVIIIHPEGYLGWKSCFAVTDQAGFMTSLDAGIIKMLRTNPANFSTLSLAEPPIPEADGPCQANQLPPAPGSQQKKRGMAWGREQVDHASDANGVGRAKLSMGVAKPRTPPITSPKLRHFVLKKKQRQAETEGKRLISIDTRPFSASVKASKGKGKARPNSSVTI
ncbi:uncharacterized protein [Diadema antillarum]|uniref:uncharacterized protein n=1 Tax=Diadema antillarum TaxID=105358 RepID=UPI003A86C277